ncbi:hypothetical protein QE152_g6958 [Popillia japonica]|uniref:Uncharacterized protein n=1 Tax=Popillia japonica TaxID=7064 RepID=A0AAW1MD42_POPJA
MEAFNQRLILEKPLLWNKWNTNYQNILKTETEWDVIATDLKKTDVIATDLKKTVGPAHQREEGTTRLDVAQKRRLEEDLDLPSTSGSEGEPDGEEWTEAKEETSRGRPRSTVNVWFGGRTRRRRMDRGKSA